jgi:hemolysin activation/secretion protein
VSPEIQRPLCRTLLWVAGCLALWVGAPLHGQTFDQVAPKQVGETPAPTPPAPLPAPPANDDSMVLLPRLAGIRLIRSADHLSEAALPAGEKVVVEGLPWLDVAKVRAISAGFLDRPLTRGGLSHLTRQLVLLCRESNHPVVEVYVPPQDVTSGVVQVVVLAARLGETFVTGNHWFPDELFTRQVRTRPGEEITGTTFLEDVDWLNQNPFRHVDLVYQKGEQPGQTDAVLRVADVRPERIYAGYEDSGNQATGLGRAFAGFNLGNLWNADNELSYQYTRSTDGDHLQADSASYLLPLPWRNTVSVFGSWARSDTLEGGVFDLAGITWQAGLRYTVLLPVLPGYSQSLVFGLDYKWSNNNLGFGGTQVFSSPASIAQALVTYSGSKSDANGSTHGSISAYFSPGGVGGFNHDSDFAVQRAGATANYGYVQASFSRLEQLPGDFTAVLTGLGQWSSARLLPSEQLGLGGEGSVRGYDERILNGDDGITAQLELRTPSRHLLGRVPDQTQALVFVDAGRDWQHDVQPGETEDTLVSAGPGLRVQVGSHGTIKADYGWQLERLQGTRAGRIQLSVMLSF